MLQSVIAFFLAKWLYVSVLAGFVTLIAYIHSPRWKTLVFSMPVPFSCIFLSEHMRVNASYLTGLAIGSAYHWVVFLVVRKFKLHIGMGIAAGVVFFLTLAMLASPMTTAPFWWTLAGVFLLWLVAVSFYRPIHEQGHRSPVPWWIKFPVSFVLTFIILSLVAVLAGAAAVFPYAGVFTSYEMRHSLRTLAGQYMLNNISFLVIFPMFWWLQNHTQLPQVVILFTGWVVLVPMLFCIYRFGFGRPKEPLAVPD